MAVEKKKRVYFENIKAQHTTHWDLDYLSQAELDAMYRKNRGDGELEGSIKKGRSRRLLMIGLLASATAGLLAVLSFIYNG